MKLKAISLFAGVGGICLGFKHNGVDIVYANDFDKYACQTYRTNFSHLLVEEDITKIIPNTIPITVILIKNKYFFFSLTIIFTNKLYV